MRVIHFDPSSELPIVEARIRGKLDSRVIRLVFDTGLAEIWCMAT